MHNRVKTSWFVWVCLGGLACTPRSKPPTPAGTVDPAPAVTAQDPVRCPLEKETSSIKVYVGQTTTLSTGLAITYEGTMLEHGMDGEFDVLAELMFTLGGEKKGHILDVLPHPQPWRAHLGHCFRLERANQDVIVLEWAAP